MEALTTEVFVTLGLALAAVALAGVAFWRTGNAPSVDEALSEVMGQLSGMERAVKTAQAYVLAAEQLWQSGKLAKESRFTWVLERLEAAFPAVDEEVLTDSIEAAVAWMKLWLAREMP